jgi:hypothetical protein
MAWIAITEALVLTRISGAELEGFRAAALGSGQADPVQPAIDQVTNLVRGYVAACASNVLGDDGKIPDKLLGAALDMLVIDIPKRAAGIVLDPTDERAKAYTRAVRLLERVADCKFAIDDPTTGETSTPTPSFSGRDRKFTHETEEGI